MNNTFKTPSDAPPPTLYSILSPKHIPLAEELISKALKTGAAHSSTTFGSVSISRFTKTSDGHFDITLSIAVPIDGPADSFVNAPKVADNLVGIVNRAVKGDTAYSEVRYSDAGDCLLLYQGVEWLQLFLSPKWRIVASCRAASKAVAAALLSPHWECQLWGTADLICLSSITYKELSGDVYDQDTFWMLLSQPIETMEADLPVGYRLIKSVGSWPVSKVETLRIHLGSERMSRLILQDIPEYTVGMQLEAFKADAVHLHINGCAVSPHYFCYAALADRAKLFDSVTPVASKRAINL